MLNTTYRLNSPGVDMRISVIAPYSAHVRTLHSVLDGTGITCKTIHKILGGENDIIILATTSSNTSRDLGFVNQPELLNVATSRQLMKLIIVGDDGETFSEGSNASRKIHGFIASKGVCCHYIHNIIMI
jgi:superfamily I DNA and/or RNA helicase